MEKRVRDIYIAELLMLVIYVISRLLVMKYCFFMLNYFDLIFFALFFVYFYFRYGIAREKNYLTRISVRYIVIAIMSYVLIIYGMGLFTGFYKSIYDFSFLGIIRNILPIIFYIIFRELIRFSVAYNSKKNIKPLIFLTIIYIVLEVMNVFIASSFSSLYLVFEFICLNVLPVIATQMLLSYMTYHVGFIPAVIYALCFGVAAYVLPIYPDLGSYLKSVIGVLFPFMIFMFIRKLVHYHDKMDIKVRGYFAKLIVLPILIFLIVVIILVSGIFKYKMIAIGSNSMNPVYYRGDAVIYEKVSPLEIRKGDILVFEKNHSIITHRVINIIIDDELYFQTKGDNNDNADVELTEEDKVLGRVKYIVKYIGYPTVWLSEKF